MASRRGFLKGIGAGVSALFLPSGAYALGHRHRRTCAPVSSPCSSGCYAGGCSCACPISFYGQVGQVYYYYCECCPGPGNLNASDTNPHNLHSCSGTSLTGVQCLQNQCFPTLQDRVSSSDDSPDHLVGSTALSAGLTAYSNLNPNIQAGPNCVWFSRGSAEYQDGTQYSPRHVALFIGRLTAGATDHIIRIGQEIPQNMQDPSFHDSNATLTTGVLKYHRVRSLGDDFHVLIYRS